MSVHSLLKAVFPSPSAKRRIYRRTDRQKEEGEQQKKYFRLATAASSNEESTNQISEFKKSKETQTTETNTKKMN